MTAKTSAEAIKGPKRPPHRPRIDVDEAAAIRAAKCHCTDGEIAAILGISVDTLDRRKDVKAKIAEAREQGKSSLRKLQWKTALSGNATMMIWLGKQYLGQTDKLDSNINGDLTLDVILPDKEKFTK